MDEHSRAADLVVLLRAAAQAPRPGDAADPARAPLEQVLIEPAREQLAGLDGAFESLEVDFVYIIGRPGDMQVEVDVSHGSHTGVVRVTADSVAVVCAIDGLDLHAFGQAVQARLARGDVARVVAAEAAARALGRVRDEMGELERLLDGMRIDWTQSRAWAATAAGEPARAATLDRLGRDWSGPLGALEAAVDALLPATAADRA